MMVLLELFVSFLENRLHELRRPLIDPADYRR